MLQILFEHYDNWEEYHYDSLMEMCNDLETIGEMMRDPEEKMSDVKTFTDGDDVIHVSKNSIMYWDFYGKVRYVFSR